MGTFNHKQIRCCWEFISKKETPYCDGNTKSDAVAIAATIKTLGKEKLVVIRQFRQPLGCAVLELPAGLIDDGETVEQAVGRERFEETGLVLGDISTQVSMFSSPGLTDEKIELVFCSAIGMPTNINQKLDEDIQILLVDIRDQQQIESLAKEPMDARLVMVLSMLILKSGIEDYNGR